MTDAANAMMASVAQLSDAVAEEDFASTEAHMDFMAATVRDLMDEVRASADTLETLVPDSLWTLPKYREMLFIK